MSYRNLDILTWFLHAPLITKFSHTQRHTQLETTPVFKLRLEVGRCRYAGLAPCVGRQTGQRLCYFSTMTHQERERKVGHQWLLIYRKRLRWKSFIKSHTHKKKITGAFVGAATWQMMGWLNFEIWFFRWGINLFFMFLGYINCSWCKRLLFIAISVSCCLKRFENILQSSNPAASSFSLTTFISSGLCNSKCSLLLITSQMHLSPVPLPWYSIFLRVSSITVNWMSVTTFLWFRRLLAHTNHKLFSKQEKFVSEEVKGGEFETQQNGKQWAQRANRQQTAAWTMRKVRDRKERLSANGINRHSAPLSQRISQCRRHPTLLGVMKRGGTLAYMF